MKLRMILVNGDTAQVFTDETAAKVIAGVKRDLSRGATVQWEDGSTQWMETNEILDKSKGGSAMYTWNKAGTKVLADVVLCTKAKDGTIERVKTGKRYVDIF